MSNQQTALTIRSIEIPSGRISFAEAGSGPVAMFVHGVVLNKHGVTNCPDCLISGAASLWTCWPMAIPRSNQIRTSP
jgi:hypothetical protein